jgi:hypothetical protein
MKKKNTLLIGGYTKTGQMSKLLNSPRITNYPVEWRELDKQAQEWEDRLYILRTMNYNTCKPHPHIEEIRELRKKLSRVDSQMRCILMQANPEYDTYWHGEK